MGSKVRQLERGGRKKKRVRKEQEIKKKKGKDSEKE